MNNKNFVEQQLTDDNGFDYSIVENDDNKVRTYRLKNGLTVFLAQNFDAPRIQTYIAVKTGSNNDPKDNTGLAHYLEHMMFKGTSKIGTSNWQEEKKLLDQISDLYEEHKQEKDSDKKKNIYKKIDEISQRASQFAIANEYDKAVSSLGASGTNAHTWLNETIYKNNIPKNELKTWLQIEKERFSELVLRLFHTELESVYEEFNRAQDNDARLVNYALMDLLFPTHPNGQQTTLGKAEHLKNPSMKAIHNYFQQYYVPNNYAMVLVGDLDFEETILLIKQYFGDFKKNEIPPQKLFVEQPITNIKKKIVKSPSSPRLQIAWRTADYGSREAKLAEISSQILSNNGEAGLLDLNINLKQQLLYAQAYTMIFNQYGYLSVVAVPKENQSLDDALDFVLKEIEKIKKGDFPDWLLEAIINDFNIQKIKNNDTANGLATALYNTYIRGSSWAKALEDFSQYATITKQEIMTFATDFFKGNYVAVYKEKGVNQELIRVDNPGITPVKINREDQSVFLKEIFATKPNTIIQPVFVDYEKEIKTISINNQSLYFVENQSNQLASLHFIFPLGTDHDKELGIAITALQYLGTDVYSPAELKQQFFRIGITHDFKVTQDNLVITISGLENQIQKGLQLLYHWLKEVKPDPTIFTDFVQTIRESRQISKKDKSKIFSALINYSKYGSFSRMTNVVSEARLSEITCTEITDKIQTLWDYPFDVFYYGKEVDTIKRKIIAHFPSPVRPIPEPIHYPEIVTKGNTFFVNYDMVQVEMSKVAKGEKVQINNFGKINVFNEYFGQGLSSIIFQEMRESKSLAYSAYVSYQANPRFGRSDYVTTYIGTQPDKLKTAIDTLEELMLEFPKSEIQFVNAKKTMLKQIASGRIVKEQLFFSYYNLKKLGINKDIRKEIYEEIADLDFDALQDFYQHYVKNLTYNMAILGKEEVLDFKNLDNAKKLSLEEIFGY